MSEPCERIRHVATTRVIARIDAGYGRYEHGIVSNRVEPRFEMPSLIVNLYNTVTVIQSQNKLSTCTFPSFP